MIKWDSDIYLTRLTAKITWDHFCQRISPSRRTWIDSISAPKTVSISLYAVNTKAISTVVILNIGSLFSRFPTPWGNFLFKRLHSCPLVSMSRKVQTSTQSHPEPCVQLAVCLGQFWGQKAWISCQNIKIYGYMGQIRAQTNILPIKALPESPLASTCWESW